jgi:hypothetical protein
MNAQPSHRPLISGRKIFQLLRSSSLDSVFVSGGLRTSSAIFSLFLRRFPTAALIRIRFFSAEQVRSSAPNIESPLFGREPKGVLRCRYEPGRGLIESDLRTWHRLKPTISNTVALRSATVAQTVVTTDLYLIKVALRRFRTPLQSLLVARCLLGALTP